MSPLALPEPFASADMGAHTSYGRRQVCWNIAGPGELFRNRYERCWVDVEEREPWRGEPLWLHATRRPQADASWQRVGFTDRGREALAALLLPLVARYGFSRLWLDLHRLKGDQGAREAMARAEREAMWWMHRSDLQAMHAEGLIEFRPHRDPDGCRPLTVPVLSAHHQPPSYENVAASAVVDGEQVGWITTTGNLVPNRELLA